MKSIVDRAREVISKDSCFSTDEEMDFAYAAIDFAEALEKNEQYWSCVAEMEDPKYCGEYAQIASDATSAALQKHGVKAGDVG